ncbi:hypothetical protein FHETE_7927 [Fusarium heterosporum]|uniref:Uncharacterized protein n=1 Tax=Fusarium heterosporum TaxID=42747 RepID=A0A8H5WKZ9_FUSHE|nr:hypothetical protein FHETE_7927 [Fusarium heterosporum]
MPLFSQFRSRAKAIEQANLDPHTWKLPTSYSTSQPGAKQTIIPDPKIFSNVFSIPSEPEFQSPRLEALLVYPDPSHVAVHLALLECFNSLKTSARALDVKVVHPPSYNEKPTLTSLTQTAELSLSERWDFLIKLAVTRFTAWWSNIDMVLNHASVYSHRAGSHAALQLTKDYLPPLDILLVWYALILNPDAYEAACNSYQGNVARLKNLCFPWPAIRDVIDLEKMEFALPSAAQNLFKNLSSQSYDILTYLENPPAYTDSGKVRFETDLFAEVKKHEAFIDRSHQMLLIRSPALRGSLARAGSEYLEFHLREPDATDEGTADRQPFGVQLFYRTHRLFQRQYKAFLSEIEKRQKELIQDSKDALEMMTEDENSALDEQFCRCWICERIRDDLPEFVHAQVSSASSPSFAQVPTPTPSTIMEKALSLLSLDQMRQIQDDLGFYLAVEDARRRQIPLPTRPPTASEKEAEKISKQKQKEVGYLPGLNEYVEVLPDGRRKIRIRRSRGNGYYAMMLF